ncbi:tRNA lysidine(34) synthetase TilS [Marinospirillum sp.]|uniref:tRNA lysidine(34) synthetase TilS n=1 Tax=Marinospirillum sp. TaxID=2183934 RepID=UPI003A891796
MLTRRQHALPMHPLAQQLRHQLDPLLAKTNPPRLCLALSGGLDSRVLLALLLEAYPASESRPQLRALHIHHGLSPHADHWADFCVDLCRQAGLPCEVVKVDPATEDGASLEARARTARYRVFTAQLQQDEYLLQAHHRQDQAETLLLRLLRGAGTQGLRAIPQQRPLGAGQLLRPLLHSPRSQLKDYAQQTGLDWVEDESNQQDHFDRNFIRLHVLPLLNQRFAHAEANLALSAQLAAHSHSLQDDLAALDLAQTCPAPHQPAQGRFSLSTLMQLRPIRRINLLRYWLTQQGHPHPSHHQWAQLDQLLHARQDAQPLVSWGQIQARRFGDQLFIQPAAHFAPLPADWQLQWHNGTPLVTPCGTWTLTLSHLQGKTPTHFDLRARQGGESLRLAQRGRRDLKRLLQESGLPPWQRQQLPLIWHQDELIAVGDLLVAEGWERR